MHCRRRLGGIFLASAALAGRADAAPPPIAAPISSEQTGATTGSLSDFIGSLERTNFLLGDMFGLRTFLSRYGISFALQETSEVLGNASGGLRQGAEYDGLTQMVLQLNTQRAFGWYGGTFDVSALDIHGRNLSADNLGTLQTSSGIESDRAFRLWELWYDQKLLDEDRLDIKVGQQSLDQEFIVSTNAAYFMNTMFGWPTVPSYDLPGGGPAYPLSDLGVRVKMRPLDSLNILLGVFSGSPAPSNDGDPQMLDGAGTSFTLNRGALVFGELQYSFPALGAMVDPDEAASLSGTYKLGFWYDTESFADQLIDQNGLSLANPVSNGLPRNHNGDYSIYAVADQMVWRNARDPNRSVSVFARAMGTPQSNRNLITFTMNAGVVMHEPITNRADDTLGLGMGYARVSGDVGKLDADTAVYSGDSGLPIRSGETYFEATYQYQARPWWQLQPDVQYVINPGGGASNPNSPDDQLHNELVIGLRTNILF